MGITGTLKVLADRRYKITAENPSRYFEINLSRLAYYRRDEIAASGSSGSTPVGRGSIIVYYAVWT